MSAKPGDECTCNFKFGEAGDRCLICNRLILNYGIIEEMEEERRMKELVLETVKGELEALGRSFQKAINVVNETNGKVGQGIMVKWAQKASRKAEEVEQVSTELERLVIAISDVRKGVAIPPAVDTPVS